MTEGDTFAISTLGCKLNFSESGSIADQLVGAGWRQVPFDEGADLYIINTCTVTENADRKCRYEVRRARKKNSNGVIVVTGCYAQLRPDEVLREGANLVLGNGEKLDIIRYLSQRQFKEIHVDPISKAGFMPSFTGDDRTRSFLKVQDGCDYHCAYCTIPAARGTGRSGDPDLIVAYARKLAGRGIREIVLTGVNIGTYHHGDTTLFQLLCRLESVEGILRYRISSVEPNLITDDIIHLIGNSDKFAPHLHIPLQSGSDKLLKRMGRLYDSSAYANLIERIKGKIPDVCIGADIIIGLPGEDRQIFQATKRFVAGLPLSYLHVFPYSPRPKTRAERMTGQVKPEIRRQRVDEIRSLSEQMQAAFCKRFDGTRRPVLFEGRTKDMCRIGFTDNYIKVLGKEVQKRNECHFCLLKWDQEENTMRAYTQDHSSKIAAHVSNTL